MNTPLHTLHRTTVKRYQDPTFHGLMVICTLHSCTVSICVVIVYLMNMP